MNIEFYKSKNGSECVSISDGKKLFDEYIDIKSANGIFSAVAGCWYINDEDSDNDGDEIENSEMLYVFNGFELAYSIKGIDCIDSDDTILLDDGRIVVFDGDQTLTFYSSSGKEKKKIISNNNYEINNDFAWFYGENENLKLRIQVIDFHTSTSWTKQLREEINEIKNVFRSSDSFVVIAGTYEEKEIELAYDIEGKLISSSKHKSNTPATPKSNAPEHHNETKERKSPALAIVIGVIIFILALIGKLTQ